MIGMTTIVIGSAAFWGSTRAVRVQRAPARVKSTHGALLSASGMVLGYARTARCSDC